MKRIATVIALGLMVFIGSHMILANNASQGEGICITISPATLVLSHDSICVTVHSNLPIGMVDCGSLLLEDISPYLTKADSLGHLVAKFDADAVKEIVSPGVVTLTLTGTLADGTDFAASDTIRVKE
ncbi:MAG: hypothetical protein JW810_04550 [Sedimentisphaerales bacterium]|nr:hypothetical protein [Sedimentisphaerales bacterium]